MFGYVTASMKELTKEEQKRYQTVYCGICRQIRLRASGTARFALSYDMAFLALLLMSLYEPEETGGDRACHLHPVRKSPYVSNPCIEYAADMNVILAYYNAADDWQDDRKLTAKLLMDKLGDSEQAIKDRWPRQCRAIEESIRELSRLEKENCADPDAVANCFGALMAELLVWREDLWAPLLRTMGMALGRFIYLADAARDYDADKRRKKYNPYLAMGGGKTPERWEEHLVLAMGSCTDAFERLPLVQDKSILDNILYSGVWVNLRQKKEKEDRE